MQLDLTTNLSQIFSEVYRGYNVLNNILPSALPDKQFLANFEEALYLNSNIQAQEIFEYIEEKFISYFKRRGDLKLYIDPFRTNKLVLGNGSTQIYQSLVYALVTAYPDRNFLFVEKIPYFSGHRNAVEGTFPYSNARWQGFTNSSQIQKRNGEILVEFITSPNNPDGEFHHPEGFPDIIIADFVFASTAFKGYIPENIEWITKYRKTTPLFSFNSASKSFGRTGDRLGYMWFPLDNKNTILGNDFYSKVYSKVQNFMSITVGANSTGAANFANFLDILSVHVDEINRDVYESLKLRFVALTEALTKKYPGSLVKSLPYSPTYFIKINDTRLSYLSAAEIIYQDTNVRVSNGEVFGEDVSYIRINTMATSFDLNTFISRLGSKKYKLLVSKRKKNVLQVSNTNEPFFTYSVTANDKLISINAFKPVYIVLSPLYGYENSWIKLKRSSGCSRIIIFAKGFTYCLREKAKFYWNQPLYRDGQWSHSKNKTGYNKIATQNTNFLEENHPSFLV